MDGFLGRRVTGSDLHIKGSVLKCREGIMAGKGGVEARKAFGGFATVLDGTVVA